MKRVVESQFYDLLTLSESEREALFKELWAIQSTVFVGPSYEQFKQELYYDEAQDLTALVGRNDEGEAVACTVVEIGLLDFEGDSIGIMNAVTASLRAYRGASGAFTRFILERALRWRAAHPTRMLYIMDAILHPTSFASGVRVFAGFKPRPGDELTDSERRLLIAAADYFDWSAPSPEGPVISYTGWTTVQTPEEAAYWRRTPSRMVQYFLENNPRYTEGYGLLCLVPLDAQSLARTAAATAQHVVRRKMDAPKKWIANSAFGQRLVRPETIARHLQASSTFQDVSLDVLLDLAQRARTIQLKSREALFQAGDAGDALYVIAQGGCSVFIDDDGEELLLDELGTGEVFGELAVLGGVVRTAGVRAATKSIVVRIDRRQVQQLLRRDENVANKIGPVFFTRRLNDHLRHVSADELARGEINEWAAQARIRWVPCDERFELAGPMVFLATGTVSFEGEPLRTMSGPALLETSGPVKLRAHTESLIGELPSRTKAT